MPTLNLTNIQTELGKTAEAIDALDLAAAKLRKIPIEELDGPEVAEILLVIDEQKREIANVLDQVESVVSALIGDGENIRSTSGVLIEKNWNKKRSGWQHDALRRVVVDKVTQLATDFETGERLLSTEQIIDAVLDTGHFDYWKIKPLKALGVEADSYCNAEGSVSSISIRRDR